jgi:hypothetical protein
MFFDLPSDPCDKIQTLLLPYIVVYIGILLEYPPVSGAPLVVQCFPQVLTVELILLRFKLN